MEITRTTREILARYLPDIIFENPTIRDCLIKALEKMAKEREHEIEHLPDEGTWKIRGDRGRHPYQWVKLGGKRYPQKWVFRLLGIKEEFHQQYAEDFFNALRLETRD